MKSPIIIIIVAIAVLLMVAASVNYFLRRGHPAPFSHQNQPTSPAIPHYADDTDDHTHQN